MIQNTSRTPDPPNFVRIYRYNEKEGLWRQLGSDVYGRLASVNDVISVDMCKSGTTLAISAVVPGSGYVEIYKYNGTDWFLMGDAIGVKNDANETVGITVTMSLNGNTVAFGIRYFQSSNLVRVYQYANDTWTQVAGDMDSQGEISARRMSLALSNDGKRVAIGPQDRTPFSKVFELKDNKWGQVAEDIPSYELTLSGFQLQSIALSGNGHRVAVLGPGGSHVAVYDEIDVEVVV
jgi:WD40 repeat protein